MRLPPSRPANVLLLSLLCPVLIAAVGNLDCAHIRAGGKRWDLKEIGGRRSVMSSEPTSSGSYETTYYIDICSNLKRSGNVPKGEECPGGTRVCAIKRHVDDSDEVSDTIEEVIPVAGDLKDYGGGDLNAKITAFGKTSNSNKDAEREGLRIELNGGFLKKRKQKAIVEFICDWDRTGTETDSNPADKYDGGEGVSGVDTSSLRFVSYDKNLTNTDTDILRLEWYTKYACEKQDGEAVGGHWGFFTWFLIIAFLVTAAYLIFGSWLNYNRYGARGWDLIPHGDTIRDVPYLLKDWTRRVVNTMQGSGSRGGYSAV